MGAVSRLPAIDPFKVCHGEHEALMVDLGFTSLFLCVCVAIATFLNTTTPDRKNKKFKNFF